MASKNGSLKICVLMDDIEHISPYKDTSFAMMLAIQNQGHSLLYANPHDIKLDCGRIYINATAMTVKDESAHYYQLNQPHTLDASELDATLIRTDPPFDREYMYTCHLLEMAKQQGCCVINNPQTLCNHNEKLFIGQFPDLCVPTLVSREIGQINDFIHTYQNVILKPLDGMGGASIFKIEAGDKNTPVILETLSQNGQNSIMAQQYIPDITSGDKRIIIIDGKPIDYALARIPSKEDHRGNLAAGGKGVGQPLSERDRHIANTIGKVLKQRGILFAGIDVIGDYLTEINITSPTGVRELDAQFNLDIAGDFIKIVERECNLN